MEDGAESIDTYYVATVTLEEDARKVAMSAKNEGTSFMVNGRSREDSRSNGTLTQMDIGNHYGHLDQNLSEVSFFIAFCTTNLMILQSSICLVINKFFPYDAQNKDKLAIATYFYFYF